MIRQLLFEDTWFPAVLAGVGFVALLLVGRGMDSRRRGRLWLGLMVLVVGLFVLQQAVTTDRERIRATLEQLGRAIAEKDEPRIAACIATAYDAENHNKAQFVAFVMQTLKVTEIGPPAFSNCDIALTGDTATMDMTAAAYLKSEYMDGRLSASWSLNWVREGDGWRVTSVRLKSVAGQPFSSVYQLGS